MINARMQDPRSTRLLMGPSCPGRFRPDWRQNEPRCEVQVPNNFYTGSSSLTVKQDYTPISSQ